MVQIEIPQRGVPLRLFFFLSLAVVLPLSVVFSTAASYEFMSVTLTSPTTPAFYECLFYSYHTGNIVSAVLFGILSDILGRKKVLTGVIAAATIYVPIFTVLGWATSALEGYMGGWLMILLAPEYFLLGLCNPILSLCLAAALDVSSFLTQFLAVLIVTVFGLGLLPQYIPRALHALLLFTTQESLGFLIPFAATLFAILGCVLFTVWKVMPETLNSHIPLHPRESMEHDVMTETSLIRPGSVASVSVAAVQENDPFEGAGRAQESVRQLLEEVATNLSYSKIWMTLWITGGIAATAYGMLLTAVQYFSVFAGLADVTNAFGFLKRSELVLVEVVVVGLLFYVASMQPEKIVKFGYFRVVLSSMATILLVAIFNEMSMMGYGLATTSWVYWVAKALDLVAKNLLLTALFVAMISLTIISANCGFRNQGGLFIGLFVAARFLVPTLVLSGVEIIVGLDGSELWMYPLSLPLYIAVGCVTLLLIVAIIRLDMSVSFPKDVDQDEESPHKWYYLWWILAAVVLLVYLSLWLTLVCVAVFVDPESSAEYSVSG